MINQSHKPQLYEEEAICKLFFMHLFLMGINSMCYVAMITYNKDWFEKEMNFWRMQTACNVCLNQRHS